MKTLYPLIGLLFTFLFFSCSSPTITPLKFESKDGKNVIEVNGKASGVPFDPINVSIVAHREDMRELFNYDMDLPNLTEKEVSIEWLTENTADLTFEFPDEAKHIFHFSFSPERIRGEREIIHNNLLNH